MMLEISFGRPELAARVERAIEAVLAQGARTRDLARAGEQGIPTDEFVRRVEAELVSLGPASSSSPLAAGHRSRESVESRDR